MKNAFICSAVIVLLSSIAHAVDLTPARNAGLRKNSDDSSGYFEVDAVKKRQAEKEAFIKKKNSIEQSRLKRNLKIKKNIHENKANLEKSAHEIQNNIQKMRQKNARKGTPKYKKVVFDNGKIVFFKDDLLAKIEYEPTTNSEGIAVHKDTIDITYNESSMMTSFHAEETDAFGNVTMIDWIGEYAQDNQQELISSKEVKTDQYGNKEIVEIYDIQHDNHGRIDAYKNKLTDILGNKTLKNITIVSFNDEGNITASIEEKTDVWGVVETKKISHMKYEKKQIKNDKGEIEYIYQLTEFKESITDDKQRVRLRHRFDITYDDTARIVSYKETVTDDVGQIENKTWNNAVYNQYGELTSYHQEIRNDGGDTKVIDWHDAQYKEHKLISYVLDDVDTWGNTVSKKWYDAEYNSYRQLVAYRQKNIDSLGKTKIFLRDAMKYDSYGGIISYYEKIVDDLGNVSENTMSDIVYNKYNQILSYVKEGKDIFGESFFEPVNYYMAPQIKRLIDAVSPDTFNKEELLLSPALQAANKILLTGIFIPEDFEVDSTLKQRILHNLKQAEQLLIEGRMYIE